MTHRPLAGVICLAVLLALPATALAQPFGFSVRSNANDNLYRIDLATGVAMDLGNLTFGDAEGLGSAAGTLYAIGGSVEELWDITTPPGAMIGGTGPRSGIDAGLAFDTTTGTMFNLNSSGSQTNLYTVNLANGAATLVGTSSNFGDGFAIDSAGNAYATDFIFADGLYSVNLANGATTFIGGFGIGGVSLQSGASFDASGTLWAITSDGRYWTINTTSGAATAMGMITDPAGNTLAAWEGFDIGGLTPPCMVNLALSQPGGAGSIRAVNNSNRPGFGYFTAVTANPANSGPGLGTGWWFGLHIDINELILEYNLGIPPFVGTLDPSGMSVFQLPGGTLPPSTGIVLYANTVLINPANGFVDCTSPVTSITLL